MNNRKKIVARHALDLFIENGIANTSIQQIIQKAGISKGTFYNYFSSKMECIEEILEHARYEATLMRSELMVGKDAEDLDVLIEQVCVMSQINRQLGINLLFEEMLHSGEHEVKNIVIRHRLSELNWFSKRLVEVFGEPLRPHAFEAAVLFYGMTYRLMTTAKLIQQHSLSTKDITKQTLHYLSLIIDSLVHENRAVLDVEKLRSFKKIYHSKLTISPELILEELMKLNEVQLSNGQRQIVEAVTEEFKREEPRPVVMNALLKTMLEKFQSSEKLHDVKLISSYIWYSFNHEKNG